MKLGLVANRSGAKFFKQTAGQQGWQVMKSFDNPEGRLRNRDVYQDSPGRTGGPIAHGLASERDAHVIAGEKFASELAGELETGRQSKLFTELMLVADPRFLGELRAALSTETAKLVVGTLGRDFAHTSDRDVANQLTEAFSNLEPVL